MELYNVEDKDYNSYLEGLNIAGKPVEFYGYYIKPITVDEVLKMGEKKYNELITPFALSKKALLEDINTDVFLLDILFLEQFNSYLESLMKAIKLFLNPLKIDIWKNENHVEIILDGKLFINGDKFEQMRKIILKMNNSREFTKEDLKVDKPDDFKFIDDTAKKRWQKFMNERKKKQESEEEQKKIRYMSVVNVYNFISNCKVIDYAGTLKLTIYQLYNSYNFYNIEDNYKYTMRLATSGMVDSKELDLTPLAMRVTK